VVPSELTDKAGMYLPPEKVALVEDAYNYASEAHEGQMRKSGDPYIEHPLQTALILAELELDASSLAAALLHDVPENCGIPVSEIEAKFGAEIAKLVEASTKLGRISWQTPEEAEQRGITTTGEGQAENLRKMLVAMAYAHPVRSIHGKAAEYCPRDSGDIRSPGTPSGDMGAEVAVRGLEFSLSGAREISPNCTPDCR